jgi:hypothetical protein
MSAATRHGPSREALASLGAARAAEALAALVGGEGRAGRIFAAAPEALAGYASGVGFELGGALDGRVVLLLAPGAREALVRALGAAAAATPDSALEEVANIVASQAVCAIAAALGARVTLSVPRRLPAGAAEALARGLPAGARALASELALPGATPGALLLLVPGAAGSGCDTVGA